MLSAKARYAFCYAALLLLCSSAALAQQNVLDFDLQAAWTAVVKAGPTANASGVFATGLALTAAGISLDVAKVYTVAVPPGNWTLHGNITIASGQLLVLQGHGPLLQPGPQQAPDTMWHMATSSNLSINVLAGGALYIQNMTLLGPQLAPRSDGPTFLPSLFSLPEGSPWAAAIIQQYVAVILDDCVMLRVLQNALCLLMTEDSEKAWPSGEVEPGWAFLALLQSKQANVTLNAALMTCSWPPPPLQPFESRSVAASNAADAPSIQQTALFNASIVQVTDAGYPLNSTLHSNSGLVPQGHVDLIQGGSSSSNLALPPLTCAARRVNSTRQLMRAVVELQAVSSEIVVIRLLRNMTLQRESHTDIWPQANTALWIYRNVTIIGRHALVARITELDFGLQSNIFWVSAADTSQLRLQQLTVANMPCGPRTWFPSSLLTFFAWPVAWDRSQSRKISVEMRNCTIVQPLVNFQYESYWVGIQSSPVAAVRAQAAWRTNSKLLNIQGSLVVSNDSHTLFIARRWSQGIQWTNTSFTDLPAIAPPMLSGCGLNALVPGDPNYPVAYITPLYTPHQLAAYLQEPATPMAMLMSNMSLTADAVRSVAPAGRFIFNTSTTVLGWWDGSTVLDLSNGAEFMSVSASQQLTLTRLYLTGLGPAAPDQQPQDLANFTSFVWAMEPDRVDKAQLILNNVTLIVPSTELAQLQSFATQGSAALTMTSPMLMDLANDWEAGAANNPSEHELVVAAVSLNGLGMRNVVITDQVPANLAALKIITPSPQSLVLMAQPSSVDSSNEGSTHYSGWQVGLTVIGACLLCVLVVVVALWAAARMRRHKRRQITLGLKEEAAAPAPLSSTIPDSRMQPSTIVNQESAYHSGVSVLPSYASNSSRATVAHHSRLSSHYSSKPPSITIASSNGHQVALMTCSERGLPLPSINGSFAEPEGAYVTATSMEPGHHVILVQDVHASEVGSEPGGRVLSATRSEGAAVATASVPALARVASVHTSAVPSSPAASAGTAKSLRPGEDSGTTPSAPTNTAAAELFPQVPSLMQVVAQQASAAGSQDMLLAALQQHGLLYLGSGSVALSPKGQDQGPQQPANGNENSQAGGSNKEKDASCGSAVSSKQPVFDQGLAALDEGHAPAWVLQQVIQHRKEMQGIDMQQITFEDVLGQGSFGVVYRGKWRTLTVAIKTMMFQDASTAKRVRQRAITEAAINSLLTHDNIVNTFAHDLRPVLGSGMPDDHHAACWKLYIIQEYCDGGSLAQAIDKGMFVDSVTKMSNLLLILQVAEDIARGMTYIHQSNVIHGDLSSSNVLLRLEPRGNRRVVAKVSDFGLSRFLEGPEHSHISNARQGTLFYTAPEVLNQGVISKPADVFSFGVLLWEMFWGTPPWRKRQAGQPGDEEDGQQPPLNPLTYPYHVPQTCPAECHQIIMACLAENPKARPKFPELLERMSQLLAMLREAVATYCRQQLQQGGSSSTGQQQLQHLQPLQGDAAHELHEQQHTGISVTDMPAQQAEVGMGSVSHPRETSAPAACGADSCTQQRLASVGFTEATLLGPGSNKMLSVQRDDGGSSSNQQLLIQMPSPAPQ